MSVFLLEILGFGSPVAYKLKLMMKIIMFNKKGRSNTV